MKTVDATDISIAITYKCPECNTEATDYLSREPREYESECMTCGEVFTVSCRGDI